MMPPSADHFLADHIRQHWPQLALVAPHKLRKSLRLKSIVVPWAQTTQQLYQKLKTLPQSSPPWQIIWNDYFWRHYRSFLVLSPEKESFLYPLSCILNPTISKQLFHHRQRPPPQTLHELFQKLREYSWQQHTPLTKEQLACLQLVSENLNDQRIRLAGWIPPAYFQENIALSSKRTTNAMHWLYAGGILQHFGRINYPQIHLTPHLFQPTRALAEWEKAYCFLSIPALGERLSFHALALPSIGLENGRYTQLVGQLTPITAIYTAWNLSQLTTAGWAPFPGFTSRIPRKPLVNSLNFHNEPVGLNPTTALYLERVQLHPFRIIRGENGFGQKAINRLDHLYDKGVFQWTSSFQGLNCEDHLVLYYQGPEADLDRLQILGEHFPRMTVLRGHQWLLMALKTPPTWTYFAKIQFLKILRTDFTGRSVLDFSEGPPQKKLILATLWNRATQSWRGPGELPQ
jgi:hypothetical protein